MSGDTHCMAQSLTSSGNCITGRFNPLTEDNFTVEFNYNIVDPLTGRAVMSDCGALVQFVAANLEGQSSNKCSLTKGEIHSSRCGGMCLILMGIALSTYFMMRKKAI